MSIKIEPTKDSRVPISYGKLTANRLEYWSQKNKNKISFISNEFYFHFRKRNYSFIIHFFFAIVLKIYGLFRKNYSPRNDLEFRPICTAWNTKFHGKEMKFGELAKPLVSFLWIFTFCIAINAINSRLWLVFVLQR